MVILPLRPLRPAFGLVLQRAARICWLDQRQNRAGSRDHELIRASWHCHRNASRPWLAASVMAVLNRLRDELKLEVPRRVAYELCFAGDNRLGIVVEECRGWHSIGGKKNAFQKNFSTNNLSASFGNSGSSGTGFARWRRAVEWLGDCHRDADAYGVRTWELA